MSEVDSAAIRYLARAVCADPGDEASAQELAAALSAGSPSGFDADLKEAVRVLPDSPQVAPQGLWPSWHGLLAADPATRDLLALANCTGYDDFAARFAGIAGRQTIDDPLFLAGLRCLLLPDLVLEGFLGYLRRFLLTGDAAVVPAGGATALAAALAQYCHYTGYLFAMSDVELDAVAALRSEVEQGAEPASLGREICVLACYEPIHALVRAEAFRATFAEDPALGPMVTELIDKPTAEARIAASFQPLSPIIEDSSRRVQDQYVEYPFPRWRAVDVDLRPVSGYVAAMQGRDLDVLVAGCGTGLEALCYSLAFPTARILAVDLSQTSLAYAVRQTAEYGVRNIVFAQADLLSLPQVVDERFDIVSSSGVLHHLEDPERGFDVLCGLLKPGGMMYLCLYSALARRHIVTAQQVAAAHSYVGTDDGIRAFRADCPRLLAPEVFAGITEAIDFYTMPQCRDLLFHVIEHRFDMPRLQALLARGGVELVGFAVDGDTRSRYAEMFSDDPAGTNLANWERFEATYPDTFFGMYKLICRMPAGS